MSLVQGGGDKRDSDNEITCVHRGGVDDVGEGSGN